MEPKVVYNSLNCRLHLECTSSFFMSFFCVVEITGSHHIQLVGGDARVVDFLPGLTLNHDPPNLHSQMFSTKVCAMFFSHLTGIIDF
jgi:hypothetical protein